MPRIKFEDRQLKLIKDSLKANFVGECGVYYSILGNALGDRIIFDIPEITSFDCDICLEKKNEAIAKHERLRDVFQARISLFEAEHKFDNVISEEDKKFLIENKGGRAVEEAIINDINDKFARLVELKKLIAYLDAKTSPKPTKQDKEPDEHYEPSDCEKRFTTPVDTMI